MSFFSFFFSPICRTTSYQRYSHPNIVSHMNTFAPNYEAALLLMRPSPTLATIKKSRSWWIATMLTRGGGVFVSFRAAQAYKVSTNVHLWATNGSLPCQRPGLAPPLFQLRWKRSRWSLNSGDVFVHLISAHRPSPWGPVILTPPARQPCNHIPYKPPHTGALFAWNRNRGWG